MKILITGAAGNLGSFLSRQLLDGPHELRLLIHRKPLPFDVAGRKNVTVHRADLDKPETLTEACRGADCVVHFAGVLFAPRPKKFLPLTNVTYVKNLVAAALAGGVRKFILISFPHVEGESFPDHRAAGHPDGKPDSVHARTRLAAEKHLTAACMGTGMTPVILRPGMIYGRGVLMIEAARWLIRHRLLAVWQEPTWEHLLALPDFLEATTTAIEQPNVSGIYNVADDLPITLQEFLDKAADHWGYRRPWRCPRWSFFAAATTCEMWATVFPVRSWLTRDFVKIGMASAVADTSRMKKELLPKLQFPSLADGIGLL